MCKEELPEMRKARLLAMRPAPHNRLRVKSVKLSRSEYAAYQIWKGLTAVTQTIQKQQPNALDLYPSGPHPPDLLPSALIYIMAVLFNPTHSLKSMIEFINCRVSGTSMLLRQAMESPQIMVREVVANKGLGNTMLIILHNGIKTSAYQS